MGELIVYSALGNKWINYEAAPMLSAHGERRADLVVGSVRYDIKTVGINKRLVTINKKQHEDPKKKVDYYLIVVLVSRYDALIAHPIPHREVESWEFQRGDRPYYSTCWSALPLMQSFELGLIFREDLCDVQN